MHRVVPALVFCLFPAVALGQPAKSAPICKSYFEALYYDQGGYRLGLSDSQIKWWLKNHEKKFASLCYSEDIGKVHYIIMWTTMASRSIYSKTVERTTQVQSSSTGTESGTYDVYGDFSAHGNYSGQSDVSTTATITHPETISVALSVNHCFIDVIRTFGPTVRDDIEKKRPAPPSVFGFEGRRGRSTSDPDASGQIGFALGRALTQEPTAHALQSALKYITSDFEQTANLEHERMATVNALTSKVHELSLASRLPESDEPACRQKIAQQIGANSEMLARLERRDFGDVESLFGQLCESNRSSSTATPSVAGNWTFTATSSRFGTQSSAVGTVAQNGSTISASLALSGSPCASSGSLSGTLDGDSITMTLTENGQGVTFTGMVASNGSSASGSYSAAAGGCTGGDMGTWAGKELTLPDGPGAAGQEPAGTRPETPALPIGGKR
jgi:hypothetical protein